MSRLERFLKREDGMAMATVVMMIAVLTLLGIVLIDQVGSESNRAGTAVVSDTVFQAAEAGINDYLAKLVDDPQYYDHYVAKGESTRVRSDTSATVPPSTETQVSEWPGGVSWTYLTTTEYPDGKSTWYAGSGSTQINGYAYNLMIAPTIAASGTNPGRDYVTIVSTGCKVVDPSATPLQCDSKVPRRAVEAHIKRMTPADFSFFYAETPTAPYGESATTYGRIYSLGDLCHDGTSKGDLLAEGVVNRSGCYHGGNASVTIPAHNPPWLIYDTTSPHTRASCPSGCPLKSAPVWKDLMASIGDIKRVAALNQPTPMVFNYPNTAIRIVFGAGSGSIGTVQVSSCTPSSGALNPPKTQPTTCTQRYNGALPKQGAIYTEQTTIISTPTSSSVVNGRVTVASNGDIVIGGHIHYYSESGGANDDVLGLVSNNDVWMANYAPNNLFWRAAAIANGKWSVYDCSNPKHTVGGVDVKRGTTSKMTFVGSLSSQDATGCANTGDPQTDPSGGFATRDYGADDGSYQTGYNALKFLFPPWFPILDTQATVLFREVVGTYTPTLP